MIVEVGSGNSYFTEKLVEMTCGQTKIVCIEPDDVLRCYAEAGLVGKIEFFRVVALRKFLYQMTTLILTVCYILLRKPPRYT